MLLVKKLVSSNLSMTECDAFHSIILIVLMPGRMKSVAWALNTILDASLILKN